jgi:hypothetical protein
VRLSIDSKPPGPGTPSCYRWLNTVLARTVGSQSYEHSTYSTVPKRQDLGRRETCVFHICVYHQTTPLAFPGSNHSFGWIQDSSALFFSCRTSSACGLLILRSSPTAFENKAKDSHSIPPINFNSTLSPRPISNTSRILIEVLPLFLSSTLCCCRFTTPPPPT